MSGNPGGRRKTNCEIQQLCQTYTHEAINQLVTLMREAPPALQIMACRELLDRGYGKPATQTIVEDTEPLQIILSVKDGGAETRSVQKLAAPGCHPKMST